MINLINVSDSYFNQLNTQLSSFKNDNYNHPTTPVENYEYCDENDCENLNEYIVTPIYEEYENSYEYSKKNKKKNKYYSVDNTLSKLENKFYKVSDFIDKAKHLNKSVSKI